VKVSRIFLAAILALAGTAHLFYPQGYYLAMPPYIPWPHALILFTGGCELAAAVGLFIPRLQKITAYCLIAFFIAITPVHIHMFVNQIPLFGSTSPWVLGGRLLFQSVFLYWAYRLIPKGT
jgi:uncharacterized membrane protein